MKNKFHTLAAWVVAGLVAYGGVAGVLQAFAAENLRQQGIFFKKDYVAEDSVSEGLTPNLLFFLDTSSAMWFAPWGVVATEKASYDLGSLTDYEVRQYKANLLRNNTFGAGMRPVMFDGNGTEDWEKENVLASQYKLMSGDNPGDPDEWRLVQEVNGFGRFGRDLEAKNNVIGSDDCYYTPDDNKPYLLTFRHRLLAHLVKEDGKIPLRPTSPYAVTDAEWNSALTAYNAISKYIPPNGTEKGNPVPLSIANKHLVPNDSRIYKLKLALWRFLEQQGNDEQLSKINFALAQTYKEYLNTSTGWGGSYVMKENGIVLDTLTRKLRNAGEKEANYFGAWTQSNTTPYVSSDYGGGSIFFYGFRTGDTNASGTSPKGVDYIGGPATVQIGQQRMGQWLKYELPTWGAGVSANENDPNLPLTGTTLDIQRGRESRSFSRALLVMPFSKLYEKKVGTPHLSRLKEYIDGIERYKDTSADNNTNSTTKFANNELFPIGGNYVATGLYGGRTGAPAVITTNAIGGIYHQGRQGGITDNANKLIQYATATTSSTGLKYNTSGTLHLNPVPISDEAGRKDLQSGQVAGSVIDFFSPLSDDGVGTNFDNGLKFDDGTNDTRGFFPVTGSCQQNWVVLFVSGNDALKDYDPSYKTADAVKKLFDNTFRIRGRVWSADKVGEGAKWKWYEKWFDMDSGVRTIVIGIIDKDYYPQNEPAQKFVNEMVSDIKAAAQNGDPVHENGKWVANENAKYYLVKNVQELQEAFDAILKRISVVNMGSGSPVALPGLDVDEGGARVTFKASYLMNNNDQWKADLSKVYSKDGGVVDNKSWNASEKMIAQAKAGTRKLYTWQSGMTPTPTPIPKPDSANNAEASFDLWLHVFDTQAVLSGTSEDMGILGDMQHSNIMVVGAQKTNPANRADSSDHTVYIQTNRGFLHAIDYEKGTERWAFVPPNIFEDRLKNLKFEGNSFMRPYESNPMFLLDGKLTANDVWDGSKYRTILTGYLGRGGNGFYAMDITEAGTEPEFLWAIENVSYGNASQNNTTKVWGVPETTSHDYSQLGLTIAPGILVSLRGADKEEIGILPGGFGHRFKTNQADKDYKHARGDVFYFFDPNTGKILQKIDTISGDTNSDTLGMGITPIIYENLPVKPINKALSFYTADSNGNILYCKLDGIAEGNWKLERKFELLTLSKDAYAGASYKGGTPVVMPYAMVLARSAVRHDWLFGGTADLAAPGSDNNKNRILTNDQQFIFGLNISNIGSKVLSTDKLLPQDYFKDTIAPPYSTNTVKYDKEKYKSVNNNSDGWYLLLRPEMDDTARVTEREYVSAPPFMLKGYLIVATFIPYRYKDLSDEACLNVGAGKIYVLSPSTGYPVASTKDGSPLIFTFENVKIVGLADGEWSTQLLRAGMEEPPYPLDDLPSIGSMPDLNPDVPHIQYWREKFQ